MVDVVDVVGGTLVDVVGLVDGFDDVEVVGGAWVDVVGVEDDFVDVDVVGGAWVDVVGLLDGFVVGLELGEVDGVVEDGLLVVEVVEEV